jgi:hypothetical protein
MAVMQRSRRAVFVMISNSKNQFFWQKRSLTNGPFKYNKTEISEVRFMTLYEILAKEERGQLTLAKPVHLIIDSLSLR